MGTRGYPLWLLRDWPAFLAVLVSFWTLIFAGFIAGRKAMRGRKVPESELQTLFQLYANAESRLDHAIWRQAWRACGYSAKHAEYVAFPAPTSTQELSDRFEGYNRALHDMELLVIAYADDLRRRFNLSKAEIGDPNAWRDPLRHASHAASPGCAGGGRPLAALAESSLAARRGRWRATSSSRDGGGCRVSRGLAQARAPPPQLNDDRLPLPLPRARKRSENARYCPYTDAPHFRHIRARPRHNPRAPQAEPAAHQLRCISDDLWGLTSRVPILIMRAPAQMTPVRL